MWLLTSWQHFAYKLTKYINVHHNLIRKLATCQLREKPPQTKYGEEKNGLVIKALSWYSLLMKQFGNLERLLQPSFWMVLTSALYFCSIIACHVLIGHFSTFKNEWILHDAIFILSVIQYVRKYSILHIWWQWFYLMLLFSIYLSTYLCIATYLIYVCCILTYVCAS